MQQVIEVGAGDFLISNNVRHRKPVVTAQESSPEDVCVSAVLSSAGGGQPPSFAQAGAAHVAPKQGWLGLLCPP